MGKSWLCPWADERESRNQTPADLSSEHDVLSSYFLPATISIINGLLYHLLFGVQLSEKKKTERSFSGLLLARCSPSMNMCAFRFIQCTQEGWLRWLFHKFLVSSHKTTEKEDQVGWKKLVITKQIQLRSISEYHYKKNLVLSFYLSLFIS